MEIPATKASTFRPAQALQDSVKEPEKKPQIKPEMNTVKKTGTKGRSTYSGLVQFLEASLIGWTRRQAEGPASEEIQET